MFKHLIFIFFILFTLFTSTSAEFSSKLHITKLKNGLQVIVLEKKTVPVVAVQMWYNVGGYHEQDGIRGMAHFFEHMMFRGSKHIGDEEHSQLIENLGGNSNAYTADDMTVYVQTLPSSDAELAIRLEAERMEHLIIDDKRLMKEKEVVKEEYRWRYQNNPYGDIQKKTRTILFPRSHYGIGPIGTLDDVSAFNVELAQSFYNTYYSVNNATLIVVGDVDHDHMFSLANTYFSHMQAENIPQKTVFKPKYMWKKRFIEETKLPIPLSLFAYYIPEARHKDMYALSILFQALSSGESSRLHKRLVRNEKLADYVYGFNFSLKETGVYAFPAVHKPGFSKKIERVVDNEISHIQKEGLDKKELDKLKNQVIAGKIFGNYSVSNLASNIGRSLIYKDDAQFFNEDIRHFENVSNDDIKRVARRYFSRKNKIVIQFVPQKKSYIKRMIESIKKELDYTDEDKLSKKGDS